MLSRNSSVPRNRNVMVGGRKKKIVLKIYLLDSKKRETIYIYKNVFFWPFGIFFLFRPRVIPRALGSVARRESARTPHASFGPGRGPWHVLWGFKVASPLGEGFRARRTIQASANPRTG